MVAIAVIRSERLLRQKLIPEQMTLALRLPKEALSPCNVASIANASGFNRETARRKLVQLEQAGLLVKEGTEFNYAPGLTQNPLFEDAVQEQMECVRRLANELILSGVFKSLPA